jgi:hypothetical protein
MPPGGRPSLTRLVIGALLPILLLTTCTSDTPLGVTRSVQSRFDATGLFQVGDEFGIPVDRVDLELRRVSDNTVAFSRTLTAAEYAASGGDLVITLRLDLDASPEDFSFLATVFSGGVEYYRASGTITAYANQSVQTPPLTPTYTGPGANADLLTIPATTALGVGQTATLNAVVSQGGTALTGVPVAYSSSDPTQVNPVRIGLNQADVTAPAAGSGSVTITAKTPNGLTTTGTLSWSPVATSIVMVSGNGQTIPSGTTAAPMVVEVRDGAGQPFAGFPVAFSVFAGPTGTSVTPLNVVTDAQGRAQSTMTAGGSAGAISIYATATGLTGSPVIFSATATAVTGPPATVTANSVLSQTSTVGTAVGSPPSVVVRDAAGTVLPGVSVVFAVASGGGSLVGPATVTTGPGGIATLGGWVVGAVAGTNTVTATVSGLTPVTFTATGVVPAPSTVTANSAITQSATVNTAVGAPPSVLVRDAGGSALAGVNVVFAVATGGGSLTGPATVATNASGIATVGGWTLGQTAGPNTMSATVTGVSPVVFTATGTAGAATSVAIISGTPQTGPAGSVLPLPLVVEPRDAFGNPVPGVTVTWATPDNGSLAPASGPTDAAGRAQSTWTLGLVATTQTATATVGTLPPATFTATVGLPQLALGFPGIPGVGIGKTVTVRATIPAPAPAGGVAVTMTSDAPAIASVPATPVTIPQGSTTADFTVTGVATGTTLLRANATGYTEGTLSIDVQVRSISVPTTLNVPFGQTASLPINIGAPAPAGGVVITVTSDNPTAVGIQTPTVTIPAGALAANAIVQGLLPGTANVTVSNPAYDADISAVTTSASLNIIQGSATLNASFGTSIDVRFESNGSGIAAPAGGVTVTLTAADPACLATNSPRIITSGLVTTTFALTYGGTATLPCTTMVLATASSIQPDSISVTVNPLPQITVSAVTVGGGLQTSASVSLGASNHGGVTVHVASADPAVALVSPDATTPGTASIDVVVPNGTGSFGYYVQGVEQATGAPTITATAPNFATGTGIATVQQPAFELQGLPPNTTTFGADNGLYVQVGLAYSDSSALYTVQNVRAGAPGPLTVSFTSSDPAVGTLMTSAGSGATRTAQIPIGLYYSPTSVASGGVAFHPLGAGTDTVTTALANYIPAKTSKRSVTVAAPQITVSAPTVGGGLQTSASVSLNATNHGGVTVHVASADSAVALVSPDATTPGTAFIDVAVPDGTGSFSYYVQGVELATGTPLITASATGFTSGSATATVVQAAYEIQGLTLSTNTFAADNPFYVQVGLPYSDSSSLYTVQNVRAGAPGPLTVTLNSTTEAVGTLVTSTGSGNPRTVQIPIGQYYSPTSVATGGVAFNVLLGGTTDVSASIPNLIPTRIATRTVTVSAPSIAVGSSTVGAGLQVSSSVSLGTSNHGGVTVHVRSSLPGVVLISPDASTPGDSAIDVVVPNGTGSFGYYVQGVEGQTGTVQITATAPGFTNGTANVTVVQPAFEIQGLTLSTTTFAPDNPFYVQVGLPYANNPSLYTVQNVRAGAPGPLTVTFTTSAPAVGALVTSAGSGPTATVQIPIGQYYTPTSIATGGVALDVLTAGSTVVTAGIPTYIPTDQATRTVAVVQSYITTNAGTVGAGLQNAFSIGLNGSNHPNLTLHIASDNPGVVLVAPDASTPGTASIDIPVTTGIANVSYYIQGVDGTTGTAVITASAPGFVDGPATATIVQPAVEIAGLPASLSAAAAITPFYVQVGLANSNQTALQSIQNVRAGSSLTATLTSGTPAVAQLTTLAGSGASETVTIPAGLYYSPTSVATGGVAFDGLTPGNTAVTVSIPGFATMNSSTVNVTVTP